MSRQRIKMTPQWVEKCKPPAEGRDEHFDKEVIGLILRVSATGLKSWYLLTQDVDGNRKRYSIGRYPVVDLYSAQQEALGILMRIRRGEREPDKPPTTFGKLAEEYLELHARAKKRPKGAYEDERRLKRHVLPRWEDRLAVDIRRIDVGQLLAEVAERGPVEANRTLALVRKMFNWAVGRGVYGIEVNPCTAIERPAEETSRDRLLTEEEIRALWKVCGEHGEAGTILRLMLVTAQRGGQFKGMDHSEITEEKDGLWWTVPAERMKNGKPHRVPLTTMASGLLGSGEGQVFEHRRSSNTVENKHLNRIRRDAGAELKLVDATGRSTSLDFAPHDLRRTAATGMGLAGVPRWVIGQVLAHTSPQDAREARITGDVYDLNQYDAEKRDALERWASRLSEVLAGDMDLRKKKMAEVKL